MTRDVERSKFLKQATMLYRCGMAALIALPFDTAGLGWLAAGLWGLVIGAFAGWLIAVAGIFTITMLWAVRQGAA